MEEDFVSFEQSIKLKKLGFDWKCNHYYQDNNQSLHPNFYVDFNKHDKLYTDDEELKKITLSSAPTLSHAQKWLFEKFGLWVEVIYEVKKESFEYNIFNKSDNTKKSFFNPWVEIIYDTPAKAFSAGIDRALEQLLK